MYNSGIVYTVSSANSGNQLHGMFNTKWIMSTVHYQL